MLDMTRELSRLLSVTLPHFAAWARTTSHKRRTRSRLALDMEEAMGSWHPAFRDNVA